MKKLVFIFSTIILVTSCKNNDEIKERLKEDSKVEELNSNEEKINNKNLIIQNSYNKIGYYVYDSLLLKCQLFIDAEKETKQKASQIEKRILNKQSQFKKWQEKWTKKAGPMGQLLSSEQEQMQREGQKWQQDLMQAEQNAQRDMAIVQEQNLSLVQGRVSAFIKEYAKKNSFDMIIAKQSTDLNYFNPNFDITKEVVDGLNNQYKQ